MIQSIFGELAKGGVLRQAPFRPLHHTTSDKAIIGGGRDAKPGEISLAHNGVLFMVEFPEFSRAVLESLRQPLEDRHVLVARAKAHSSYPYQFMLITHRQSVQMRISIRRKSGLRPRAVVRW